MLFRLCSPKNSTDYKNLQAVPTAKQFTEGQLQPAAKRVADQAVPTAKTITDEGLRPAAAKVAESVSYQASLSAIESL